jgi:hypothetical protein
MKTKLRIAVLGLVLAAGLAMGLKYYGYEKTHGYTAATAGVGTITAADGQLFAWAAACRHVVVTNAPASPANLYLEINGTTANPSASGFMIVLEPGQTWAGYANTALTIEQVAIYADAAVTYGTDFVVKGVD